MPDFAISTPQHGADHRRVIHLAERMAEACDELQMAAATKAEFAAPKLSSPDSDLFREVGDLRGHYPNISLKSRPITTYTASAGR